MHYWPRRPPARQRKPPGPPARLPAGLEILTAETFDDRPLGAVGEMLGAPPPTPPRPATRSFVIEPVDWEAEERERAARDAATPPPPPPAVAAGDYDPEPLDLRPPIVLEPLRHFEVPAPDWRREELELAARELPRKAAAAQAALEPDQPRYPAKKRGGA